jgi:putative transposase
MRLRMREIAKARVRYGYRKIRVLLNREGWNVSRYLAYRLYQEEGLARRPKRSRRRRNAVPRRERFRCTAPNQVWGVDFIADQLIGWTALSSLDGGGHLHTRKPGD